MLVSSQIGGTNKWDIHKAKESSLISVSEVKEMEKQGMEFGSHTMTHRPLAELTVREAQHEITDSKATLQDLLGHEVSTFCFPHGSSSSVLTEMVRQAGYIAACGIEQRDHTLFNMSRIDVARCRDSRLSWRFKLSGLQHRLRECNSLRRFKSFLR